MVSYGVMNFMMVSTPLAMHAHDLAFHHVASVIKWHILGMYVPAFFTGHLIHRCGMLNIMLIGALVMLACAFVNLSHLDEARYWVALCLLGIGWNFFFAGAATLLAHTYRPEEKVLAQGFNDLLVFGTMTLTSASSGFILSALGWQALNYAVMPFIVVTLWCIGWLKLRTAMS